MFDSVTRCIGVAGLLLAVSAAGHHARADICFGSEEIGPGGTQAITLVDLDQDGALDVLAMNRGAITWYRNVGAPQPEFAGHVIASYSGQPDSIAVTDIDLDGDLDVLIDLPTVGVAWYRNDGLEPPGFSLAPFASPIQAWRLIAEDVDGDGDDDLVVSYSNTVAWHENTGGDPLTFVTHVVDEGFSSVGPIGARDVDGDGDVDLFGVSTSPWNPAVYWFESDGAPTPTFTSRLITTHIASVIDAADVDGDGDVDIVSNANNSNNAFVWYANDGMAPPTFVTQSQPVGPGAASTSGIRLADIDDDGDIDVAVSSINFVSFGADSVSWFENDGSPIPSFTERVVSSEVVEPHEVLAGDLDGDGDLDLVSASGTELVDGVFVHQHPTIINADSGARYTDLAAAILDALPGQTLLADETALGAPCAEAIDLLMKPLTVQSIGDVERTFGTTTILADAAALETAPGSRAELRGQLTVPGASSATISAGTAILDGEISLGPNAVLSIDGVLEIRGAAGFTDPTAQQRVSDGAGVRSATSAADIDGDGDVDVAVLTSGRVSWFRNEGAGNPPFTEVILANVDNEFDGRVWCADLDGDGDTDVVHAGTEVRWFESDGPPSPTFIERPISSTGASIAIVDLDNDGDLDLAAGAGSGPGVVWFENDGASPPAFVERAAPGSNAALGQIQAGDFNGDGSPDLLGTSNGGVVLLEGDGQAPPSFTEHVAFLDAGASGFLLESGDVDRDGDLDLFFSRQFPLTIAWLDNVGGSPPSFQERAIGAGEFSPQSLDVADFDLDGDLDLVTMSRGEPLGSIDGVIKVFVNDGAQQPSFDEQRIGTAFEPYSVEAADMDGDADPDVLITFADLDGIAWYTNRLSTSLTLEQSGAQLQAQPAIDIVNRRLEIGPSTVVDGMAHASVDRTSHISGAGTLAADLIESAGVIEPSSGGSLTLDGDYSQSLVGGVTGPAKGTLQIDLGDGMAVSSVSITGEAALEGTLIAFSDQPLTAQAIDTPTLLSANSLNATRFDVALLPNIGATEFLSVVYTAATLRPGADRAAATVSLQVNPLSGDIELDPQATANAPAGAPQGAVVEDLDLDGDPDLILALPDPANPTTAPGSIVVLYNIDDGNPANGWEGFGQTLQITTGVGIDPSSVAVGPIDADAQPDVVVTNKADSTLSVLLIADPNAATFSTSDTRVSAVGVAPEDVILDDLDKDGFLDAATANEGDNSITILWNAGNGIGPLWDLWPDIDPVPLPEDSECPLSIRPGDGDAGFRYLATANAGNDSIGLVQIDPATRIATVLANLPCDTEPREVIVADLDNDGDDDVATVNRAGSSVSIALNETSGGVLALGATSDLPIDAQTSLPISITSGDYDDDLDTDLAVLADGVVKVLRNDLAGGQLAFTPIPDQAAGIDPLLLRTGDLNVDGRDDVVTVSESTGGAKSGGAKAPGDSVGALVAAPPAPACAGDVNGDGATDVFDFADLAANFGAGPGATRQQGDLTGDGFVDVFDFGELAANFGCGPAE